MQTQQLHVAHRQFLYKIKNRKSTGKNSNASTSPSDYNQSITTIRIASQYENWSEIIWLSTAQFSRSIEKEIRLFELGALWVALIWLDPRAANQDAARQFKPSEPNEFNQMIYCNRSNDFENRFDCQFCRFNAILLFVCLFFQWIDWTGIMSWYFRGCGWVSFVRIELIVSWLNVKFIEKWFTLRIGGSMAWIWPRGTDANTCCSINFRSST